MNTKENILSTVRGFFSSVDGIAAVYVHGSFLTSQSPHDLDIALLLKKEFNNRISEESSIDLDFVIPLEMKLEILVTMKTDIHVINNAPLAFRFSVVTTGECVLDNEPDLREQYELLSRVEYFDFRPRIEEYLKDAFTL
jgi:predicted nucleotidyltransferase